MYDIDGRGSPKQRHSYGTVGGGAIFIVMIALMTVVLVSQVVHKFTTAGIVSQMQFSNALLPSTVQVNIEISFPALNCGSVMFDATDSMGSRITGSNTLRKYSFSEQGQGDAVDSRQTSPSVGCIVRGSVMVNRVPGNLHISSTGHHGSFLDSPHANMTHTVHHLSFGSDKTSEFVRANAHLDDMQFFPLDGLNGTQSEPKPKVFEYYLKAVSTVYHIHGAEGDPLSLYEFTANSHTVDSVFSSSVYFRFDFSPITVEYREVWGESLSDCLIELMSIFGGIYAVSSIIHCAVRESMRLVVKNRLGKLG